MGVPLAAKGQDQPIVCFVHLHRDFYWQMELCQNGEEEKDLNQSSTSELSCFMCWKNRVPSGW